MTQEQEQSLIDLQRHSATLDSRLTTLETNFAVFVQEMKDFKDEVKDFKKEVKENQAEMRNIGKHVQNLTIAAFAGIGATVITAVIGVAAMVWSSIPK